MGAQIATIIIEPRFLLREALASLMANLSYRVVCSVGSTMDIAEASSIPDGQELVILGARSAEEAAREAVNIRKLRPDSKIVLLFESASPADLQKLLISQIDGFVPLFVSTDTLSSMLNLIITQDLRVMIVANPKDRTGDRTHTEEPHNSQNKADKRQSSAIGSNDIPVTIVASRQTRLHEINARPADTAALDQPMEDVSSRRNFNLSDRETQILDGLVKGHANKVIARTCDISEATVKVHMKSILRKIRVANRTQAAIWALEHGYCPNEHGPHIPKVAATRQDAAQPG